MHSIASPSPAVPPESGTRAWRWLRLTVVASVIIGHALLIALQRWDWGPLWLAELSRYLPYYWLLVPCVAAVLLSLGLPRILLLASIANLLVLGWVTMGWQWNRPADNAAAGLPLRVLSYNVKARNVIHSGGEFTGIEREIRRHQADIVTLQDADGWVKLRSDMARLSSPPMFGLPHVYAIGQYVVASRYPLQACAPGNMPVRDLPHQYLSCQILIDGHVVQLVTAHFVSPRHALVAARQHGIDGLDGWIGNYSDRLSQAGTVRADVARMPRPLILTGDLNAAEQSPVVALFTQLGLRDTFSAAGQGWGYTHGHALQRGLDFLRIDHVLVSADFDVVHSTVGGSEASEHKPVVADLVLHP